MTPQKMAIIDIGSKTVRLSIYERNPLNQMEEIEKRKVSLRLSEHVENGSLTDEGLRQLIDVLQQYERIIHSHQVEEVDCIATAAIRNANNHEEVVATISEKTAFSVRLLSGDLEAYYGLLAITKSLNILEGIAIDLGGGSTEITLFKNQKMVQTISIPFGVVTLAKRYSDGLPMSNQAIELLSEYVIQQLSMLDWIAGVKLPIIGLGGSVRLIGKYSLTNKQMTKDLNGYSMTKREINLIAEQMKNMKADDLFSWANENADLALPALIVLDELMNFSESELLICCTQGIKDGMIYSKDE